MTNKQLATMWREWLSKMANSKYPGHCGFDHLLGDEINFIVLELKRNNPIERNQKEGSAALSSICVCRTPVILKTYSIQSVCYVVHDSGKSLKH